MQKKHKKRFTINDVLKFELEDDNTTYGGVSFLGETVADFIGDTHYWSIEELNKDLVACGIKPIEI